MATAVTSASDTYQFSNRYAADFLVLVDTTATVTTPYGGSTTIAAAMAPTTGTTNPRDVTLCVGQTITTAGFGYNWSSSIGDTVWWDTNTNRVQDSELGISNAFLLLYFDANNNGVLDQAYGDYQVGFLVTDADGHYLFNNLPPARYLVDVYEDSITTDGLALPLGAGLTGSGFLKPARPTARHFVLTPIPATGPAPGASNALAMGLGQVKLPAYLFNTSLAVR